MDAVKQLVYTKSINAQFFGDDVIDYVPGESQDTLIGKLKFPNPVVIDEIVSRLEIVNRESGGTYENLSAVIPASEFASYVLEGTSSSIIDRDKPTSSNVSGVASSSVGAGTLYFPDEKILRKPFGRNPVTGLIFCVYWQSVCSLWIPWPSGDDIELSGFCSVKYRQKKQ